MFPSPTIVHFRPFIKGTKRPQSAPGSTDARDQSRLPARQAPILLPAADSDSPLEPLHRSRPVKKSLSCVASDSNLRRIEAESPDHQKPATRIRKLPPLPLTPDSPAFATTVTSPMPQQSRSQRPLPLLPIAVSSAGEVVPRTPPPRSASLPRFRLPPTPPPTSTPRLATAMPTFQEPPSPGCFSPVSPLTPAITLEEAKNKNIAKLRRFLGESLPPDLVVRPNSRASSSTTSSEGSDLVELPDQRPSAQKDITDSGKRISRKWVREKGGHRWVESDYQDVLSALRKL